MSGLTETSVKMADMSVYDDMNFFTTHDKFVIQPNGHDIELIINRLNRDVTVQEKRNQYYDSRTLRKICGILGLIKLIDGYYLVVATYREFVGVVNGQAIWRLAGHDFIPYSPSSSHLTDLQKPQNDTYRTMLNEVLNTPFFYFSYDYDISHSLQQLNSMPADFKQLGLAERANQQFVWNGFILKEFMTNDLRRFCLPIVHGFISINQVNVNNNNFTWALISRRSVNRAGTRLFCRGINVKGHCSNFVETEQLVEYQGDKVSFVQTRGSIPLYWNQTPNLRYKPRPRVDLTKEHLQAATLHFDAQVHAYGRQILVNLIDHRGAEDLLEKGYKNLVAQLSNSHIRYESFDFHAECRKMQWDRLNILIDRLAHEQDEYSVFHIRHDGTLLSQQNGVFRTNCIDCLDRTNVVQSMLAKRSLKQTLQKLGILRSGQNIESTIGLEMLYKNVWADNADLISIQYSGTGALKTDFTRTGKRTISGAIKDGINSLARYYKNNFRDGYRQDAIDFFLGKYVIKDGEGSLLPCPLVIHKGWKHATFPSVLLFAVAMFFASATLPHEYNTENMLFLLFWGAMVGVTVKGIFLYGNEFVDFPKLLPLADKQDA